MKWYEQKFVNRRDWILDHLDLLSLNPEETIVVLLIDFMNEHQDNITVEGLAKKSGLSSEKLDKTISLLCAKKYLDIRASASSIHFSLNGLFEADTAREEGVLNASLFDQFETELKRPLNNQEMVKISEWNRTMDKKMILYALREASAYQKLSIAYIDKILSEWKAKGITLAKLEEGKY